jgi:hypothetical protein
MLKQVFMKIFDVLKKLPVPTQIVSAHFNIRIFFTLGTQKFRKMLDKFSKCRTMLLPNCSLFQQRIM